MKPLTNETVTIATSKELGERMKALCPNCDKGKNRLLEVDGGYKLCGLCKGKGWVYCVDEGYSTKKTSIFGVRSGLDVVRVRAIESKSDIENEKKTAKIIGSAFLGYYPYYKTLVQNDIN